LEVPTLMMKRKLKQISSILFLTVVGFSSSSAGIREDVEQILINEMGDSVIISHQKINIPKDIKKEIQSQVKQKFFKNELNVWTILTADTLSHYAIIDNSLGKSMPITFLVIFTTNGRIKYAQIIKYREP